MRSRASTRRGRTPPERHREHPAQARKAIGVPFDESVENRLGIGMRAEVMTALFQFPAQFEVIVDLAVEDDNRIGIRRNNRLVAVVDVDDFQAGRAEGNVSDS